MIKTFFIFLFLGIEKTPEAVLPPPECERTTKKDGEVFGD
jgi:hypothetical protein